MVDYRNVDLFWDVVVGNGAIDLYWERNGGIWCSTSLLARMLKRMTLHISTRDGVVGLRCGRVSRFRSLLGTLW